MQVVENESYSWSLILPSKPQFTNPGPIYVFCDGSCHTAMRNLCESECVRRVLEDCRLWQP
jgi:hypothetical protein